MRSEKMKHQNITSKEIKMTLGEKLSKARRKNNYTQEQLVQVLGVSGNPSANGKAISHIPKPKN